MNGRTVGGPWLPLARHFFRAHFDLGFLSDVGADAFGRVILGSLCGIVAFALLLGRVFLAKYDRLAHIPTSYTDPLILLNDEILVVSLSMLIVALVAILISRSILPTETDYRVLMVLPVTRETVLAAKLAALFAFLGLYIGASGLAFGAAFTVASQGPWTTEPLWSRFVEQVLANVLGAIFAALGIIAVFGATHVCLPGRWARAIADILQTILICSWSVALLFVMFFGSASGAVSLPPAWFVAIAHVLVADPAPDMSSLATIGELSLAALAAIVAVCHVVFYKSFDLVMVRNHAAAVSRNRSASFGIATRRDPPRNAVAEFMLMTIRRSGLHRGVFAGTAAFGIAVAAVLLMRADTLTWLATKQPPTRRLNFALSAAPFIVMFTMTMGFRAALLLPIEQRANWIFRITEFDWSRVQRLAAVERGFRWVGLVVPLAAIAPLYVRWLGPQAVLGLSISALWGSALLEVVLADWTCLPFTRSYIPGKRFIVQASLLALSRFLGFVIAGVILLDMSLTRPILGWGIVAVLFALSMALRRLRFTTWGKGSLSFEDQLPEMLEPLHLAAP